MDEGRHFTEGTPPVASIAERLLAVAREAHAVGGPEAAYHALAAGMHAADDTGDVRMLADIGREAEAQIAWIDAHAPEHRLSTLSASRRDHPGVYAMLLRQVTAHLQMRGHRPGS